MSVDRSKTYGKNKNIKETSKEGSCVGVMGDILEKT